MSYVVIMDTYAKTSPLAWNLPRLAIGYAHDGGLISGFHNRDHGMT